MTGDRAGFEGVPALAGGAPLPRPETSAAPAPSPLHLLDRCDGLLGEVGRRMHRFSWLRAPGAPIDECVAVDSYYPGNRIVVMCGARTPEEEALCGAQVPAHGLRLLQLRPEQFAADSRPIVETLAALIGSLAPVPPQPQEPVRPARRPDPARSEPGPVAAPPPPEPEPRPSTPLGAARWAAERARAAATATASAATLPVADAETASTAPGRDPRERAGIVLGVTLVCVVAFEMMLFVAIIGFAGGRPVLAIGFAFDVCSRALGTIAFAREGDDERAWTCLIVGSLAVVNHTLLGDDTVRTEPAPLAGGLGALAIVTVVLGLLGGLL